MSTSPSVPLDFVHRRPLRGLGLLALLGAAALSSVPAARAHATFDVRLAELNEQLARQPDNAALRYNLAELYCEHEQPIEALAALARAESLPAAGELPVDYLRGMCLRLAERPAEALVALDRYVAANPENSAGHLQRARVHAVLGNILSSLDDYRAALRFAEQPEPDLVQETSDALARIGFTDEALAVIDAGLSKLGPIPSLTLRAIDLEVSTGRIDAALARIAGLQKAAPRPEPWMARRATILARAGRGAEARAAWQALADHLAALPATERSSHAMSRLGEQARLGLVAR